MKARSVDRAFAIVMAHLEADAVVSKVIEPIHDCLRALQRERQVRNDGPFTAVFDAQSTCLASTVARRSGVKTPFILRQ